MQTVDVNKFLFSLAVAVASRANLVFDTAGQTEPVSPRQIWLHEIQAAVAADPATALRMYAGASPAAIQYRKLVISLQFLTRGTQSEAVLGQAVRLQEAMLSDAGHPAVHWLIPGKRFNATTKATEADTEQDWKIKLAMPMQTPGNLGRDENEKWMASCNYEIEFLRVAKG